VRVFNFMAFPYGMVKKKARRFLKGVKKPLFTMIYNTFSLKEALYFEISSQIL
jgi:hypothetical protein